MRLDERHLETLETVEDSDSGMTSKEIMDEQGTRRNKMHATLRFLRNHNIIEYSGSGKPHDPYVYEGRS